MDVVLRILPFFALVAVGALAARLGALTAAAAAGLSRYVYWLAFPALLLHALAATKLPGAAAAPGLLAYVAALACPYLMAAGLGAWRRWPGEVRAALPLLSGVNNDAFLGAPLVLSVLGPAAGAYVGPLVALNWVLLAPAGVAVLHKGARGGSWPRAVGGALLNPVTVGALLGAAAMLLPHATGHPGWPAPVETVVAALAASSTPVALVALGAVTGLEGLRPEVDARAPVLAAVALRLLAAPLLAWTALTLAGAPPALRAAAVVLAACPTAVTGYIQAQAYAAWPRAAAQTVVLTTLLSAATLTALLAALAVRG